MILLMICTTAAKCYGEFLKLKIAGIIPVDKTLHVIVGYFIMLFMLKKFKTSFLSSLFVVAALALLKELIDSRVLNYTLEEGIMDFSASIILPSFMIFIRKLKTGKYS